MVSKRNVPAAKMPEAASTLLVKLKDADGTVTVFKVKRTTKFSRIIAVYAARAGVREESIRLALAGSPIDGEQTADELDLDDDGEEIDVINVQLEE